MHNTNRINSYAQGLYAFAKLKFDVANAALTRKMSNTVFSLEWLAASSQGFSDTPETLPSGTDSDINKVDAFSCSSLFFAPETQSGSGGYSSTTIVPQLNDPYYSAASLQHSLPDFSSIASTDGILPPNTTADGILPPNTTGKFQGCKVCGDAVSGNHFGVLSCDACKNFFRRSTRMKRPYACRGNRSCTVSVHTRSRCQYCRLKKCLAVGMKIQGRGRPCGSGVGKGRRIVVPE